MRGEQTTSPDTKKAFALTKAFFRPNAAGALDRPATVYLPRAAVSNAPLLVIRTDSKEQYP